MVFLGTTFLSGQNTIDPIPIEVSGIQTLTVKTGSYDMVYVSSNSDNTVEAANASWNSDVKMNAKFDTGDLSAGNSDFSLTNTDYVVIKRRKVGELAWTVIYTQKIESAKDFKFVINDFFTQSKQDYEYMITSVCNGIENGYVLSEIKTEYEGVYICDKNNIYGTLFDLDLADTTIDTGANTQSLLNNKYAIVTKNGDCHYETGNITATFVRYDVDKNNVNVPLGIQFRKNVKNWLDNKKPKILKTYDGRIWLISVHGSISDTGDGVIEKRKLGFDWAEIGDVEDMETLYINGLSDVGREWW